MMDLTHAPRMRTPRGHARQLRRCAVRTNAPSTDFDVVLGCLLTGLVHLREACRPGGSGARDRRGHGQRRHPRGQPGAIKARPAQQRQPLVLRGLGLRRYACLRARLYEGSERHSSLPFSFLHSESLNKEWHHGEVKNDLTWLLTQMFSFWDTLAHIYKY